DSPMPEHDFTDTEADREKNARLTRLMSLPPGSAVPIAGKRKRGRPITVQGAVRRELGFSRLGAWKAVRLARLRDERIKAIEADLLQQGRRITTDGVLRRAGMLSPDRPRPRERAQTEALQELIRAREHLQGLERKLREVGSDEELGLLANSKVHL